MHWFNRLIKVSAPALTRPKRYRELFVPEEQADKSQGTYRQPKQKWQEPSPPKGGIRFYNFLKASGIKAVFFHGTATSIYDKIERQGYMLAPRAMGNAQQEERDTGLDQVFYTTSPIYANTYANRSAGQTKSKPLLLKLEIPLHLVTEIRDACLGVGGTYNEYDMQNKIREIVRNDSLDMQQKALAIIEYLDNNDSSDEFTTFMLLPIKYITNVFKLRDPKADPNDYNAWNSELTVDEIQDPDVQRALKRLKPEQSYYDKFDNWELDPAYFADEEPQIVKRIMDDFLNLKNIVRMEDAYGNTTDKFHPAIETMPLATLVGAMRKGIENFVARFNVSGTLLNEDFPVATDNSDRVKFLLKSIDLLPPDRAAEVKPVLQPYMNKAIHDLMVASPWSFTPPTEGSFGTLLRYGYQYHVKPLIEQGLLQYDPDKVWEGFFSNLPQILEHIENSSNNILASYIIGEIEESAIDQTFLDKYHSQIKAIVSKISPRHYMNVVKSPATGIKDGATKWIYSFLPPDYFLNASLAIKEDLINKNFSALDMSENIGFFIRSMEEIGNKNLPQFKQNIVEGLRVAVKEDQLLAKTVLQNSSIIEISPTDLLRDAALKTADSDAGAWAWLYPSTLQKLPPEDLSLIGKALSESFLQQSVHGNNAMHMLDQLERFSSSYTAEILLPHMGLDPNALASQMLDKAMHNIVDWVIKSTQSNPNFSSKIAKLVDATHYFAKYFEKYLSPQTLGYIVNMLNEQLEKDVAKLNEDPNALYTINFGTVPVWLRDSLDKNLLKQYYSHYPSVYNSNYLYNLTIMLGSTLTKELLLDKVIQWLRDYIIPHSDSLSWITHIDEQMRAELSPEIASQIIEVIRKANQTKQGNAIPHILEQSRYFKIWKHLPKDSIYQIAAEITNAVYDMNLGQLNLLEEYLPGEISEFVIPYINEVKKYIEESNRHEEEGTFLKSSPTQQQSVLSNYISAMRYVTAEEALKMIKLLPPSVVAALLKNEDFITTIKKNAEALQSAGHEEAAAKFLSILNFVPSPLSVAPVHPKQKPTWKPFTYPQQQVPQQMPQATPETPMVNQASINWFNALFIKTADDQMMTLDQMNVDQTYDKFKTTYEDATGASWDKQKFVNRAGNWVFYGDENGYVAVRPQASGLYKLVGMAGSPKSIYRGMQELLAENKPTWGMVSKDIADMAGKVGFRAFTGMKAGMAMKIMLNMIPPSVFGGAQIQGVGMDGGVTFNYKDVGTATKYFICNQAYIDWMLSQQNIPPAARKAIQMVL